MRFIAWILTGLLLGVVGHAVAPTWQAPRLLLTVALGILGGLGGGLLIDQLAQGRLAGFTAGEIGSIMGAAVLLAIGSVLARPHGRAV